MAEERMRSEASITELLQQAAVDPGTAMRVAVVELYSVFARYPLRARIEGCSHCVSESDHERLRAKPLRQLSAEDLYEYAFKAMYTWGEADDFRHFLPRLFELIAFEKDLLHPEMILGKLAYAGWQTWPAVERASIETYLVSLWPFVLSQLPEYTHGSWEAEECLCSIGQVLDDLRPFLDFWEHEQRSAALLHLAQLLHVNAPCLIASMASLCNPWWEERQAQMQQVIEWLFDVSNLELLEQAVVHSPTVGHLGCPDAIDRLMAQLRAQSADSAG